MRIKTSVGRAKSVCIDNYVQSLQFWAETPLDPFVLAAIARALTGKASTLWLAMYEEADRCVEDQRKLTDKLLAKSLSKPASKPASRSAVRAAVQSVVEDQHQLTKKLADRKGHIRARRNSKKPTRRRST